MSGSTITEWGECLPDCPSQEAVVACLSEPQFPRFVQDENSNLVNFTATYKEGQTYEFGSEEVLMDVSLFARNLSTVATTQL